MSVVTGVVDHHQPSCRALERSTPVLVEAIRRAPGQVRPAGMRWTNAEIAAHMLASVTAAEQSVRGLPSDYDAVGPTAELDERMVAQVTERDPIVLADLIEQRTASFLGVVRGRAGSEAVATPRANVGTFVGLLALDHHLHGGQFTQTTGLSWAGRVPDLHSPLHLVLAYAFDPEAARDFRGSFTLRLRGVEPVRYAVDHRRLQLDGVGRTDCTISSDPQAFLRFGIGVVSQLRLVLTGKLRISGRRPWAAGATSRLFPPVPHGGVAG